MSSVRGCRFEDSEVGVKAAIDAGINYILIKKSSMEIEVKGHSGCAIEIIRRMMTCAY